MSGADQLTLGQCPNHCKEGKIFNQETKKFVPCEFCASTRQKSVQSGSLPTGERLAEVLGFERDYMDFSFNPQAVVASSQARLLEPSSVGDFTSSLSQVYESLNNGIVPSSSAVFSFDREFLADKVYEPFLLAAYRSGLSVAPVISSSVYHSRMMQEETALRTRDIITDFRFKYFESDVVIVLIPSTSVVYDIMDIKGLMQTRASMGKATIFLTSLPLHRLDDIVSDSSESKFMARGFAVKYISTDDGLSSKSAYYQRKQYAQQHSQGIAPDQDLFGLGNVPTQKL